MTSSERSRFDGAQWSAAEHEVLSSGHEDTHGLWEVLAGVNSALPELEPERRTELTRAVVLELLDQGHLELRYGRALQNKSAEAVPRERWSDVLTDPATWDPFARGEDDPYYTLDGTEAGVQAYYRSGRN